MDAAAVDGATPSSTRVRHQVPESLNGRGITTRNLVVTDETILKPTTTILHRDYIFNFPLRAKVSS